ELEPESPSFGRRQNRRAHPRGVLPLRPHRVLDPGAGLRLEGPESIREAGISQQRRRGSGEQQRDEHRRSVAHSPGAGIRLLYLCAYAALAALGEALAARPALLWIRAQGVLSPALAWDVPCGPLLCACAAGVAVHTLALTSMLSRGRRPGPRLHLAFL